MKDLRASESQKKRRGQVGAKPKGANKTAVLTFAMFDECGRAGKKKSGKGKDP